MDKSKSEAVPGTKTAQCTQEEHGMSSPIPPTQGSITTRAAKSDVRATQGDVRATRSDDVARRTSAPASAAAPVAPPVSLQIFPSSPPQQVLNEMASAARVHDGLRAQGQELHFAHDPQSGRMTVQVRDSGGRVLRTISPSEALEVAAGKPLE
jgi:uncharacterized FlaG/YvyC family protein